MPYSDDPKPQERFTIPTPFPNLPIPTPWQINALKKLALFACEDPPLLYAEMFLPAFLRAGWEILTPSTKEIIRDITGESWVCGARRVVNAVTQAESYGESPATRFLFGLGVGLDIVAWWYFLASITIEGFIDWHSAVYKALRDCENYHRGYRGYTGPNGWIAADRWQPGPVYYDAAKQEFFQPNLNLQRGEKGRVFWHARYIGLNNIPAAARTRMRVAETGEILDQTEPEIEPPFTIRQPITRVIEYQAPPDEPRTILGEVQFLQPWPYPAITDNGGYCYRWQSKQY